LPSSASNLLQGLRMTDLNTTLPPALRRALELLADPPTEPDVSNGYFDLLDAGLPTGTPAVEAVFAAPVGSMVYDNMQALIRRLFTVLQQPMEWLNIPAGGIALDVGCGTVTASLARAAGQPSVRAQHPRHLRPAQICGLSRITCGKPTPSLTTLTTTAVGPVRRPSSQGKTAQSAGARRASRARVR
jgi:hypothetical protein